MPSDNYIALVIGGLAVALVGMALMALYSIAAGAAMTSHLTFTETPDEKRRCKISDGSPRQCYRARRNQRTFRILNPCPVELLGVMNNPDQETVLRAIEDARRILGEYIEAGQSDAVANHGASDSGTRQERCRACARSNVSAQGAAAGHRPSLPERQHSLILRVVLLAQQPPALGPRRRKP